jgi:hypothetical protein
MSVSSECPNHRTRLSSCTSSHGSSSKKFRRRMRFSLSVGLYEEIMLAWASVPD